jgi:hypothetical protein
MKSSGFNIDDINLTHLYSIERLFAVMIIAFAWSYLVGIYKHTMIKPIRELHMEEGLKRFSNMDWKRLQM